MANPLRIATIWRIIRDVDLEGIRSKALSRFELWVTADEIADATALATLVSPAGAPHPWIRVAAPPDLPDPPPTAVDAAILVSRSIALSDSLTRSRLRLSSAGIPVVVIIVGHTGPAAAARGFGEHSRVAVTALDDAAVRPIATAILELCPDDRRLAFARQLPPIRP